MSEGIVFIDKATSAEQIVQIKTDWTLSPIVPIQNANINSYPPTKILLVHCYL